MVYWYVWVAIQVALFVLAELLRPKPDLENAKPAALGDFQFPTATEDRVVPLVWGTVRQKGPNVVWYGDYFQEAITKEVKVSLFKKIDQVVGFRYHLGMQLALCRGPVDALRRIWIGDVEVYSAVGIMAAAINVDGTGYQRGDVLTLSGGTFTTAAQVRVDRVSSAGDVERIKLIERGEYSVFPSGASTSTTGGSGSGCTITMTKGSEVTAGQTVTVDCPELFGGDDLGQGGVTGTLTFFSGTDSQAASPYLSSSAYNSGVGLTTVPGGGGGTGYAVGNVLTVSGGTFNHAAQAVVTGVSGTVVTTVSLIDPGFYTAFPSNPASTSVTPAGGTGCTLTLTTGAGFQSVGGVTPRYLRNCYLAPSEEALYLGNSTSIKPWAFEVRRIPNPLALGDPLVNVLDANPANVLVEILTNTEWGMKRPMSEIDTSNWTAAATTLRTEGNGFSFLLDRAMDAGEMMHLIEDQIDAVVFFNQSAGKWQINLARGGYDVNTLDLLSVTNVVKLESYARGAWEDTTNQVAVKFADRDDQYKSTSALAQDQANIDVMQGRVVPAELNFPGVKNRTLANALVWRELVARSYPLAKATILADRTMFAVQPGQVLAWTYEIGGESFTRMALRVMEIDYGELEDGQIRLSLLEDVFRPAAGSFSDPGDTNWSAPGDDLKPFDYYSVVEAPRAITSRDPAGGGPDQDKLWAAARRKGPEVGFEIAERHAAGSPTGGYTPVGTVYGLMLVGRLSAALARGSAVPLTSMVLIPGPDSQGALEGVFLDSTDVDLGTGLLNLVQIGTSEYALVTSAQTSGGNVQLNGVYRGAMDSVQGSHAAGTPVYVLFAGAGLSDSSLPATNNVDVKLVPFSRTDRLPDSEAPVTALTMGNRVRRPYPPSRLSLDGTAWPSTTSMEANGSGPENYAIDISDVRRRDYRTDDEVQALTADASTFFADFPAFNSTVHKVDVRNDPAGANTLLFTSATFGGTTKDIRRIDILLATDGVLPTTLRFDTFSRHTHDSVAYDSRDPLRHDFMVTSALSGQFQFTALDTNDVSATYTVNAAGVHAFTLSSAFTAGDVEVSINLAAFTTLIAAGGMSGSTGSLSVSDTIRIRHTSTDAGALKQLSMDAPGAGTDGYAILFV